MPVLRQVLCLDCMKKTQVILKAQRLVLFGVLFIFLCIIFQIPCFNDFAYFFFLFLSLFSFSLFYFIFLVFFVFVLFLFFFLLF